MTRRASPVGLAALSAGLILAHQVAAKALRDSLFLANLPSSELPKVMLAAALVGLPAVLGSTAAMSRFGPGRSIPALLLTSAAVHVAEWGLLERSPRATAVLVYLHVSVLGGITISGFWSIVNERFDPHGARRAVGIVTGGAGTGGLVGGLLAERIGSAFGLRGLLVALFGGALLGALGAFRLGTGSSAPLARPVARTDLRSSARSSYLRSLATLVALTGFAAALTDYAFKAAASASLHSAPELVRFFSAFYVATSVVTVVFQLTVSRQTLDRIGLGGSLAALPFAILACGAVASVAPRLLTLTLLSGAVATLQNSLYRSSYELLYTPLPALQKRSTKAFIDVACGRFGEVVASGLVLLLLVLTPSAVLRLGIGAAVLAAALSLRLSMRIQTGYVSELAASLRNGSVRLDASRVEDLTTRLTLSQTQFEFDRAELLRQIALSRQAGGAAALSGISPAEAAVAADLCSGDVVRTRSALTTLPLDPRHASLVIPLLESDELSHEAINALCTVAPRITGQLVDALLDRDMAQKVRRRIPRVLRTSTSPRAVRGLVEALSDPDFEVRCRSALALHELSTRDGRLRVAPHLLFEAAERELGEALGPASPSEPREPESGWRRTEARRLDHVFSLLGLALDREALELARRALGRKDEKLRGTALEYLENVVPERVRGLLWPRIEARRVVSDAAPASRRPTRQILDELKRSIG